MSITRINGELHEIPEHLRRYVVDQDYSRYTPIDQAVWRYIMRQLSDFLISNAHHCYAEGLEKTGIEIDRIPRIEEMSKRLSNFGWKAIPVSGFIPPAAFMELQSLSYLPIASDMRSIDHILYTPAPDIIHEAAGHAPILVDPAFADYLKKYAQVARKAIVSEEDINLYESIRLLSDIKENPNSSEKAIRDAEENLEKTSKAMTHTSEAGLLGRMNWWTAEYGLIGTLENPKIFGAGLLSSIEESRNYLSDKVVKIPLTIDCLNYSYDITEPQPQLFVTKDFSNLVQVLDQLADQMGYKTGGISGLNKAIEAKTVNTVQYSSGLQVAGLLSKVLTNANNEEAIYLSFSGPCQLAYQDNELGGHGTDYHNTGFGSPIGALADTNKKLEDMSEGDLGKLGLYSNQIGTLNFASGIEVTGVFKGAYSANRKLLLLTFENCTVKYGEQMLFDPSWGTFDMAIGDSIDSVFGGPADRMNYPQGKDFPVQVIPRREFSSKEKELHGLYQLVRDLRESTDDFNSLSKSLNKVLDTLDKKYPNEWLLRLECFEISCWATEPFDYHSALYNKLNSLAEAHEKSSPQIKDGLRLASKN